jgi:hypothetical protein
VLQLEWHGEAANDAAADLKELGDATAAALLLGGASSALDLMARIGAELVG